MANGSVVEFSAKVDGHEYDRFKDAFPQYGAVSWFINQSLKSFNDHVERTPALKKLIDSSIQDMLDRTRNVTLTADEE